MKIEVIHAQVKVLSGADSELVGEEWAGDTVAVLSDDGRLVHGIFGPRSEHSSHFDAETFLTAANHINSQQVNVESARAVLRTEIRGHEEMVAFLQDAAHKTALRAQSLGLVVEDMERRVGVSAPVEPKITRSQMIAAFQRLSTERFNGDIMDTPEAVTDIIFRAVTLNEAGATR